MGIQIGDGLLASNLDLTLSFLTLSFRAGGYNVERAWGEPSAGVMLQVVNEVKSRLLDFILELSEKLPESLTLNEIREKSKDLDVSAMFRNAVFGPNTTIVVGDNNVQHIRNQVITNNFESLADVLRANQVHEDDIESLRVAIDADAEAPELAERKYGKEVSG